MIAKFFTSLAGRLILIGIILAVLIFGISQCQSARTARTEARLSSEQGQAASESARDAIGAVGAVSGRGAAGDQLTRENEADIRAALGADAQVSAEVRSAGLAAICKRAAYRDDPRCVK